MGASEKEKEVENIGASEKEKEVAKTEEKTGPEDRFYFVHITFFLIAIGSFIPYTFFTTATEYWMYKFRDTSLNTTNSEDRNSLQTHFDVVITISGSIIGSISLISAQKFFHLINLKLRTTVCLAMMVFPFILATCCVYLDTDSWQMGFFVFTIIQNLIIYVANESNSINCFEIMANLPSSVLKLHLVAQGITGIFVSGLQVLSLWLGPSVHASALIYFLAGTGILTVVLIAFLLCEKCEYYQYYVKEPVTAKQDSYKDLYDAFKKIWPLCAMFVVIITTQMSLHPTITALVVSEYEGTGPWADRYFTPVATFLLDTCGSVAGRTIASNFKFMNKLNGAYLLIGSIIRSSIFVFLIIFCNAQPRNHLSVLFPHDYQYILILASYGITTGFFYTLSFTAIENYLPPEKLNTGFSALLIFQSVTTLITSPLNYYTVDIL